MNFPSCRKAAFALPLLLLSAQPATAGAFNFSSIFAQDDNYQFFTFTLNSPGTVNLATDSYTTGGFVPYLYVWDSAGVFLSGNEATLSDASYTPTLSAGTYYASLTVANNKASGDFLGGSATPTPDVFNHYGAGNFTYTEFSCNGGAAGAFYDSNCGQHSGAWVLYIEGVDSASLWPANNPNPNPAPEPATLSLILTGAAALFARRRRSMPV